MSNRSDKLNQEIEELESKLLGNHASEEVLSTQEEPVKQTETQGEAPPTEDQDLEVQAQETPLVTVETEASVPESTEAVPPEEIQKPQRTNWKKRYQTYKSSTDATIFKLRREVTTLNEENVELSKQLSEQNVVMRGLKANSEDIYKDLFSEEERDIVGDETIGTLKKATQAAVNAAVQPLQDKINELEDLRIREKEARVSDERNANSSDFLMRLERLAPDYDRFDKDPHFHGWMKEPDEASGLSREYLFKQAQAIGDVRAVASYFNRYKDKTTSKKKEVEKHIAPSKTTGSPAPSLQPKENTLTWAFINKFYDDCARGKYKGKEKLRQELDQKIDLAIQQRRVR